MAGPPTISEASIRVLLIDDDEDDACLTRETIEEIPGKPIIMDWQPDCAAALDAICNGTHDVYLVDYRLGDRTGLDLIREAQQRVSVAPLILLTGQGQREIDIEAMKAGAADYLEKGKFNSTTLERSIRYAMQNKRSEKQLERLVDERTAELDEANTLLRLEIQERRRAEEALRDANQRKDEFLATLAHELRNPLAPIRNAIEIMRLGKDNPQAGERGRVILERQVKHMVRLIDDLLDISRITRGKIEMQRKIVDLASIIEYAIEGSRPNIALGRHQLAVDCPAEPIAIYCDRTRVSQVLINLLNNAAKYSDPEKTIRLNVRVVAESIEFEVVDEGVGISEESLPRIFEMFSQVDRTRDKAMGGLGVGLSLARKLVEMHGGSIQASSEGPDKGSKFTVRLPLNQGTNETSTR